MPPFDPPAPRSLHALPGKSKRLKAITDFAKTLEKRLSSNNPASIVDDQLLENLQTHIRSLHAICQKPNHVFSGIEELDRLGTSIWNASTRLLRDTDGSVVSSERRKLAVYSRVLSFHLLDAAREDREVNLENRIRLTRLALKAGKSSIEASELEMASFVMQKGADYTAFFSKHMKNLDNDDAKDVRGLEAEYFILRTALSWKQDCLDVAEHMYNKGHVTDRQFDTHQVEKLADVLYEIGRDMTVKKDFQMAAKWLERAQGIIGSHDLEQLSREALELRTAIMQAYVTALVHLGTTEDLAKAEDLIHFLQLEMGSTMVVLVLRLELLTKTPAEVFDGDAYAAILSQMITCFSQKDVAMDLAEQSAGDPDFRLITHHIDKLHEKAPTLGIRVLDEFLRVLARSEHDEWVERLVTKRIWVATRRGDSPDVIEAAQAAVSVIKKPLRADATVAVQTLIWKSLQSAYNQQLYDTAELWCKLAFHRIFENTGPLNRAKIERKHLLCALKRNDVDGGRSIYHSMAEETQKEPRTVYLMYKIAIRSGDREAATTCLEGLSKATNPVEYLYACCLDAQENPNRDFAIDALTSLLEKNAQSPSSSVQLPALFRCTVRLIFKDMEAQRDEAKQNEIVLKLLGVFDQVISSITSHLPKDNQPRPSTPFTAAELDWFARTAYNIGLSHLSTWDLSHTIRLLTSCNAIMSHIPRDISLETSTDLSLKSLFNHFIIASALLSRARAADSVEDQLQDYLLVRRHVAAFDSLLPNQLPHLVEGSQSDLRGKLAALLTFDFEAAVALKSYDDLSGIILKTADTASVPSLQAQADILLRSSSSSSSSSATSPSRPPTATIYSSLRSIVDALFTLDFLDPAKLARYMRCLLQITLPFDDNLAFGLVGEYTSLLKDAARENESGESEEVQIIPKEETEWLATTAFNHGVDCYFDKRDGECRRWCFAAFELAGLVGDGGGLMGFLQSHFLKLKFDVE